jgi:membrane protein
MFGYLKRIVEIWGRAGVGSHAAATGYYAIFSLAPLILVAITVAGLVVGNDAAQAAILDQFGATFGADFRAFATSLVVARQSASQGLMATFVGIIFIVLGASGIFGAMRAGLDEVFENLPEDKKPSFWNGLINQFISVGMVLSVGFLLLVSLLLSTFLASFGAFLRNAFPGADILAWAIDFGTTYVLISYFLSLMLVYLPTKRVGWGTAARGGFIAGAIFVLGKYSLSYYFALAHPGDAFGAASTIVILVLWTYYLALGLFFSAIAARVIFEPA